MNQDLNKGINSFKNSSLSFQDDVLEDRPCPSEHNCLIRVVTTKLAGCPYKCLSMLQKGGKRLVSIKI